MFLFKIFLAMVLLSSISYAQVNTEVLRQNLEGKALAQSFDVNLGYQEGNNSFFSQSSSYRMDWNTDRGNGFGVLSSSQKSSAETQIVNRYFGHLRHALSIGETRWLEGFVQREQDEFIFLESRTLLGTGIRQEVLKQVYLGVGVLFEYETLSESEEDEDDDVRLNTYLSWKTPLSAFIHWRGVTYLQVDVSDVSDTKVLTDQSLNFKMSKRLNYRLSLVLRYDSKPPGDLAGSDIEIQNGFSVNF